MRYPPSTFTALPELMSQSDPPEDKSWMRSVATRLSRPSVGAFWWRQRQAAAASTWVCRAAMMRELAQHGGELGARQAGTAELGGHAELQEAALAQRRDIGADELVRAIAAPLFLGELRTQLGEHGAPIGRGRARIAQSVDGHGMLL